MIYLTNAFSIQMLANLLRNDRDTVVRFRTLTPEEFRARLSSNFVNAIGHQGTVEFLNKMFGLNLTVERRQITVNHGDEVLVVMPFGARLPPGAELTAEKLTELYGQGLVKFIEVSIP